MSEAFVRFTPAVKSMFVAPTPNAPTPIMADRSFRSTPPPDPKNKRTAARSSSPATVNLRATKGRGAKAETAYLTATGLVQEENRTQQEEFRRMGSRLRTFVFASCPDSFVGCERRGERP